MSSSDRLLRLVPPALALVAALGLAGCFRPMYASTPNTPTLAGAMAAVSVDKIEGRVGQQVRNALDFGFTGGAGNAPPRYRLAVELTELRTSAIVDVRSDEPQVDTVTLTGTFKLFPVDKDTPVLTGKNVAAKSFDRDLQRFAALRAARDAENSAAQIGRAHV